MKYPNKKISNPLPIIALFAMIAEASGTIVLPFLSIELQRIYIWFLIGFPILLLLLFFLILWKKHHVLYGPEDYNTDESFLKLTGIEVTKNTDYQNEKIIQNYFDNEGKSESNLEKANIDIVSEAAPKLPYGEKIKANYWIAEDLMQKKLSLRYGNAFNPEIEFKGTNFQYRADGFFENEEEVKIFEIKYFDNVTKPLNGIGRNYKAFTDFKENVKTKTKKMITFTVIIVSLLDEKDIGKMISKTEATFNYDDINFEYQNYNSLKQEFRME